MGSLKTIGKTLPLLLVSCAVNVGAWTFDEQTEHQHSIQYKGHTHVWTRPDEFGFVGFDITDYVVKISSLEARVKELEKQNKDLEIRLFNQIAMISGFVSDHLLTEYSVEWFCMEYPKLGRSQIWVNEPKCIREIGYGSDGKVYWRVPYGPYGSSDTLKSQPPTNSTGTVNWQIPNVRFNSK